MSTRFIACTVCARHVRETDGACPFCNAKAPIAPALRSITKRLSRAAMHAAGAAGAIVALNDCGGQGEPLYGSPCIERDGACNGVVDDAGSDGRYDTDAFGVFYGGSCVGEGCPDGEGFPIIEGGDAPDAPGTDAGDAQVTDGPTDAGDGG